ncbi:MAG: phosphohistidine phosphatase SixA [Deltaproteobacteria bacterium]|nr:phosphohistidine phosphatase SixA [Deltaproteobacteria bacterium]
MNLFFLRHGSAIEHGDPRVESDTERFLTPKGIKRLRQAARGMRALGLSFDAILTSPAVRARQTAQIVAVALKIAAEPREMMDLAPESTVEHLIFGLSRLPAQDNLLLVGHEPLLTQACSFLLALERDQSLNLTLKKAGLCHLEVDHLPPSEPATLHFWLTPKQLRQLGETKK